MKENYTKKRFEDDCNYLKIISSLPINALYHKELTETCFLNFLVRQIPPANECQYRNFQKIFLSIFQTVINGNEYPQMQINISVLFIYDCPIKNLCYGINGLMVELLKKSIELKKCVGAVLLLKNEEEIIPMPKEWLETDELYICVYSNVEQPYFYKSYFDEKVEVLDNTKNTKYLCAFIPLTNSINKSMDMETLHSLYDVGYSFVSTIFDFYSN
ncbi:hypothetical protein SNEBB_008026 [Seison nebaliae]|nr:hypothetical protein SNEBB_008026 [Seison nebaliae]